MASMMERYRSGLSDAVVRTIREPLLILDAGLRIRVANPAFCRAFRVEPRETEGRSLFDLGNGQWDITTLRKLLLEVLPQDSTVEDFEVEHDFPGIGRRCMLLNARRLEAESDREELVLLAIRDVTEWRAMEQDLRRSNQELERFAYVASHDLQEPLRMVASYTRLLARRYEGQLDDRADKYIRYAVDGAERMKVLIQDLLTYSRVGTRGDEPVRVEADEVLNGVLSDLRMSIQKSGARITRDPLPALTADPGQLRQLFQNLVENAIKFSGDEPPVIHVSGRREGDRAVFSIRDRGIGIDPQFFDRIFVIFQRLHGRETSGTGIGLALSKRIVERHGGEIWLESAPGEGSTFHFSLPAEAA
jgi:light-regulated signal transduction histidine kinase (bacteriophytochrome)